MFKSRYLPILCFVLLSTMARGQDFSTPLAALHAAEPKPANNPDVIVLLSDDLGWADDSCYGSTFHESPNLDKEFLSAS